MARAFNVIPPEGAKANCAAPAHLPTVDAAFERPGGPAGIEMRERICPGCPIGAQCLAWAMQWREDGIWGGISPKGRTNHGAPPQGTPRVHQQRQRSA